MRLLAQPRTNPGPTPDPGPVLANGRNPGPPNPGQGVRGVRSGLRICDRSTETGPEPLDSIGPELGRPGLGPTRRLTSPRPCLDCSAPITLPLARYCDACRWRHRGKRAKWVVDPAKEKILREGYYRNGRCRARFIAKAWGFPLWVVKREAARRGLARRADRRLWTPDEDAFLQEHAGVRHSNWIRVQLRRSEASVVLRLRRLGLTQRVSDGYTLRQLEEGLGVDHKVITRWIERGWLKADRRNPSGLDEQRYPFQITERSVLAFVRDHREEIPLHRVDPTWFLDLVLPRRSA